MGRVAFSSSESGENPVYSLVVRVQGSEEEAGSVSIESLPNVLHESPLGMCQRIFSSTPEPQLLNPEPYS
jgi:hypothetical protein